MIEELENAQEPKQSNMLALVGEYGVKVLVVESEAERLAEIYMNEGVIPARFIYDGLHISIATINDLG